MTGDFAVGWTPPGRRSLNRLPPKVAFAVLEFIHGSLAANPARVGRPLRLELEGLHAARRGDYRILYEIEAATRTVLIVAVEHRADAYRRR